MWMQGLKNCADSIFILSSYHYYNTPPLYINVNYFLISCSVSSILSPLIVEQYYRTIVVYTGNISIAMSK